MSSLLPPSAPTFGRPISRAFGRFLLRTVKMKVGGTVPDVPKAILLGVPHTTNWDLIFPFGGMFKKMGGIPIDRKAAKDVIGQVSDWFDANEKAWIGITPEGTRAKVESYKRGYLRIAYATGIPVFVVGVDSVSRTLVFDQFMDLTGDIDIDNRNIREFVRRKYTGLKPKNS